ncbi:MAG: ATP-grasp domain-containing protein, partial [Candidatus Hydrogenedentes bacterium]|nr:ATP-grasp domain-containing protein [Candidatus Hydrogenedentota bacterium]
AYATASASRELGLRGPAPDVVALMLDKGRLRQALSETLGGAHDFAVAASAEATMAAAKRLRSPWVVKPLVGDKCRGVSFIAHAEDMPLGYKRASAQSAGPGVLVEEYVQGDEFVLDGVVCGGALHALCVSMRMRPAPPMLHDLGMLAPVVQSVAEPVNEYAQCVVRALGYDDGPVRLELVHSGEGFHVIEASPCVCGGRLETDLARVTSGMGAIEATLSMGAGADWSLPASRKQAAALLWMPARSGVVEEIRGLDEARAIEGIADVEVNAAPGDWIGHLAIRHSHERIGYVLAAGTTSEEALAAAREALKRCEAVTRATISAG